MDQVNSFIVWGGGGLTMHVARLASELRLSLRDRLIPVLTILLPPFLLSKVRYIISYLIWLLLREKCTGLLKYAHKIQ